MSERDLNYFLRRAAQEEAAAKESHNSAVARAHRGLAARYRAISDGRLSLAAIRKKRWLGTDGP